GPRCHVLARRAAYLKFGPDVQEDALKGGERPDRADWGQEPRERWGTLGAGDDVRPVPTVAGAYQALYDGVAVALRTGTAPPVDPNDSVAGLQVIEAAQRAARLGRAQLIDRAAD